MPGTPTTFRSTCASRDAGLGSRRAELENAVSVGSSTREVKKSGYLEALPSIGAAGPAGPSVLSDGWAGFGGCSICRPEMSAAERTNPELIRLPFATGNRVAHLHLRTASLTSHDCIIRTTEDTEVEETEGTEGTERASKTETRRNGGER